MKSMEGGGQECLVSQGAHEGREREPGTISDFSFADMWTVETFTRNETKEKG